MDNYIVNPQRVNAVKTTFFGKNAIYLLPEELSKMKTKRALIITDSFLYETGVADKVGEVLLKAEVEYAIYYDVKPNPTVYTVNECTKAVHHLNVDLIVAVGGGSAIDTAKAVSILAANGGKVADFEGVNKSTKKGIPIVAINTTAGTGSEVTSFYVVTDEINHRKMVMVDTNCIVEIAINDIDFMLSMPESLTAQTGMDALTHGIEAVFTKNATPITDKDALWSISEIIEFLPRAVKDGNDLEARVMMAYAQNTAGFAFSNSGLGMIHSMAHALGGMFNLPHGICNAILLPYVLEYYLTEKEYSDRFKKIFKALNQNKENNIINEHNCVRFIFDFMNGINVPISLKNLANINFQDFEKLADAALIDTCMNDNLVKPSKSKVLEIYKKAYNGGFNR